MKPILVLAIVIAARDAAAERVRHVPPAGAVAGESLELVAEAAPTTPTLTAHLRTTGQPQFQTIELVRRDDAHWVAVVPAASVVGPGLDYFLEAGGMPVFASAETPHTLPVHAAEDSERRARDLVRSDGHRSRIHTMAEWVTYGNRLIAGRKLADRYYRIDADFTYRVWAYPLEEIRFGYTRLLGDVPSMMCEGTDPCTTQAGFKVGGWFELGLAPIEGIRFDTRAMFMATQSGFSIGGRVEARLGALEGSHVAVGVEHLADVGTAGFFRLGWGTVPGLPMAATVEITDQPQAEQSTGVRLYYDIARDIGSGVKVGVRVGYAARNQAVAGFTGGGGLTVDF